MKSLKSANGDSVALLASAATCSMFISAMNSPCCLNGRFSCPRVYVCRQKKCRSAQQAQATDFINQNAYMTLEKNFKLGERYNLSIAAQATDLFNHTQFRPNINTSF